MKSQQLLSTVATLAMLAGTYGAPTPTQDHVTLAPRADSSRAVTTTTVIGTSTLTIIGYKNENDRFYVDEDASKAAIAAAEEALAKAEEHAAKSSQAAAAAAAATTEGALKGIASAISDGAAAGAAASATTDALLGIIDAVQTAPAPSANVPCSNITWPAGEPPDAISAMCDPRRK